MTYEKMVRNIVANSTFIRQMVNLQTRNIEKQIHGNPAFSHQNFAKFYRKIHCSYKKKDISKIVYFTDQSLSIPTMGV